MKRLTSILAAALALAACSKQDPADQYRKALPTANTLTITAPDAGAAGATALTTTGASTAMTADGKSELAVTSYLFATSVNGGVAQMLWLIHSITWWTPTSCDDNTCTWGPGSSATDLNVFKLEVTKTGSNYDYTLSAAPKSTGGTAFLPIVIGFAHPGSADHRGDGNFSVKFENAALLDKPVGEERKDWGTLDVRYDTHAQLKNEVVFWEIKDNDNPGPNPLTAPNRLNVYFNFDASKPNGELLVAWETLYGNTKELALFTQWKDAGGRADLHYYETDGVSTFTHDESECWDGAPDYLQTYDNFDLKTFTVIPPTDPAYGDPAACVFAANVHGFPTTLPAKLFP
jgi:hypothetical protein